jgi:hypothetical protein
MIYTNENGDVIEINRFDYVSEHEYYASVENMLRPYVVAPNVTSVSSAPKLENLEKINDILKTFHNKSR